VKGRFTVLKLSFTTQKNEIAIRTFLYTHFAHVQTEDVANTLQNILWEAW